jgi:hypothetical protein
MVVVQELEPTSREMGFLLPIIYSEKLDGLLVMFVGNMH